MLYLFIKHVYFFVIILYNIDKKGNYMVNNQSLIYEFNNGRITEIDKSKFIDLMISLHITSMKKEDLLKLSYKDIIKLHIQNFKKLDKNVLKNMGKIITVLVGISKIDVLASTEFVYNPNSITMGTPQSPFKIN